MSFTLLGDDLDAAWLRLLQTIEHHGAIVAPRGRGTLEVLNHSMTVDLARPVLTVARRRVGYHFMCAEAAWILGGDDRVATLAPYSQRVSQFSDDGVTFFGAYGPKLRDQLDHVVGALRADPDTRQAVASLWRERPPTTKDVPCTLSCQFLIRDARLHCLVTMRSSDAWLGVPYDVFSFSMWAAYVLLNLGDRRLGLGTLYNTAASRHLYDVNRVGALACLEDPRSTLEYQPFNPWELSGPGELIELLWARAERRPCPRAWLAELPA